MLRNQDILASPYYYGTYSGVDDEQFIVVVFDGDPEIESPFLHSVEKIHHYYIYKFIPEFIDDYNRYREGKISEFSEGYKSILDNYYKDTAPTIYAVDTTYPWLDLHRGDKVMVKRHPVLALIHREEIYAKRLSEYVDMDVSREKEWIDVPDDVLIRSTLKPLSLVYEAEG